MGVKVCDAIMGSGKSSAAITYINEHPEKKYIYLAPYLEEATRIKEACPEARFTRPARYTSEYGNSKIDHTFELLAAGRNIASTHAAMKLYSDREYTEVKRHGYTVIIDEALDVLDKEDVFTDLDKDILLKMGYVIEYEGELFITKEGVEMGRCAYSPIMKKMRAERMIKADGWYWKFPEKVFENAADVFILTYLFEGSQFQKFLEMSGIDYSYIGIKHTETKDECVYRFTANKDKWYVPEYVNNLGNLIDIYEDEGRSKLNRIGENFYALSEKWYKDKAHDHQDIKRIKRNIWLYFQNYASGRFDERMVGAFGDDAMWRKIVDKGYTKARVTFNQRASNKWSNKKILVYPVNVFHNPVVARYYQDKGAILSGDQYALSTMIQWIWRSAIRNGESIRIYIPSRRMRGLLKQWIEETSSLISN